MFLLIKRIRILIRDMNSTHFIIQHACLVTTDEIRLFRRERRQHTFIVGKMTDDCFIVSKNLIGLARPGNVDEHWISHVQANKIRFFFTH